MCVRTCPVSKTMLIVTQAFLPFTEDADECKGKDKVVPGLN
jgi:hypothetical protein